MNTFIIISIICRVIVGGGFDSGRCGNRHSTHPSPPPRPVITYAVASVSGGVAIAIAPPITSTVAWPPYTTSLGGHILAAMSIAIASGQAPWRLWRCSWWSSTARAGRGPRGSTRAGRGVRNGNFAISIAPTQHRVLVTQKRLLGVRIDLCIEEPRNEI